ncbi:MAG TPA: hypothetical protein DDW67_01685 [Elusimicrobia bacterium]|nr:hypothetical protein [Elusimicrobiota bacterium]
MIFVFKRDFFIAQPEVRTGFFDKIPDFFRFSLLSQLSDVGSLRKKVYDGCEPVIVFFAANLKFLLNCLLFPY